VIDADTVRGRRDAILSLSHAPYRVWPFLRSASPAVNMNRPKIYVLANAAFLLCIAMGSVLGRGAVHPLYLILLFALCTSPVLSITRLNDRYALLGIFSFLWFLWYGNLDLIRLWSAPATAPDGRLIDRAEVLILAGGVMVHIAYRLTCRTTLRPANHARDWSELALMLAGAVVWLASTWLVWKFKVEIIADASVASITRGLSTLSALQTDVFMLATYLQPCSIVILAYALFRYRRSYMIPLVAAIVVVQFILGFVDDSKGEALSGIVILLVTKFLVDGRVPKIWLAAAIVGIGVMFPLLQANRAVRHQQELTHVQAAQDIGKAVLDALQARETTTSGRNRAQSVFERASLKDTVEVIVAKTGRDVAFQSGATISPLLTAFIPRLIWPTKRGVQVGLLVAREFFPSQSADVNLSPSHLGELYWNFGWSGVLIGMILIGALLGFVGGRFNLAESVSLTRVLVLAVTIQIIIIGFEATIATQYSQWSRLMLAIGCLHVLLARTVPNLPGRATSADLLPSTAPALAAPRFSNLMR
jgi:hypothetical protein